MIHYNCWQYDYYDEPLVAIVSTFINELDKSKTISSAIKRKLKDVLKQVGKSALSIGAHILEAKTGVDIEKEIDELKDIAESVDNAKKAREQFDTYLELTKALDTLVSMLNNVAEKVTIVLCVDELDRCLPEYTIKVLERLHHLTENIINTITIISVDKEKLEGTVSSIFGDSSKENSINASEYLKKFIRFEIKLDKGKQNGKRFFEKYPEYYSRFDESFYPHLKKTEQFLEELFCDIDIRSQEQIVEKAAILNDICFGDAKQDHTILYMLLFIATLYYHRHDQSVLEFKKKVDKLDNVFYCYPDIPSSFKNKTSGFNFQKVRIVETMGFGKRYGLLIDLDNIFMIIFYYWYNSTIEDGEYNLEGNYYPFIQGDSLKIENNLLKIRDCIKYLDIIS